MKHIFEIGTFDRRTTLNMAYNSPLDTKIYTLDLPKEQKYSAKLPLDPYDRNFIGKVLIRSVDLESKYKKDYSVIWRFSDF